MGLADMSTKEAPRAKLDFLTYLVHAADVMSISTVIVPAFNGFMHFEITAIGIQRYVRNIFG
jgi:hypothetical protein